MQLRTLRKNEKRKKTLSQLKKILWKVFTAWVKKEGGNICFTCGVFCEGKNCHGGHFIKKSICGIELYFSPANVKIQCYKCNIFLDGNQYEFGIRLGEKTVAELKKIQRETKDTVWTRQQYEEKIKFYTEKLTG